MYMHVNVNMCVACARCFFFGSSLTLSFKLDILRMGGESAATTFHYGSHFAGIRMTFSELQTHPNLHSLVSVGPMGGHPQRAGTNLVGFVPVWLVMTPA